MLQSHDGKPLAVHEFGTVQPGESWQTLAATLKATGTDAEGQFALLFLAVIGVWKLVEFFRSRRRRLLRQVLKQSGEASSGKKTDDEQPIAGMPRSADIDAASQWLMGLGPAVGRAGRSDGTRG
jgi:hypothetical protein